eukprot:scaffold71366_cov40-Tisochrysis_lutea.AAC.2
MTRRLQTPDSRLQGSRARARSLLDQWWCPGSRSLVPGRSACGAEESPATSGRPRQAPVRASKCSVVATAGDGAIVAGWWVVDGGYG